MPVPLQKNNKKVCEETGSDDAVGADASSASSASSQQGMMHVVRELEVCIRRRLLSRATEIVREHAASGIFHIRHYNALLWEIGTLFKSSCLHTRFNCATDVCNYLKNRNFQSSLHVAFILFASRSSTAG